MSVDFFECRAGSWAGCADKIVQTLDELRLAPFSCVSVDAHNNSPNDDAIISCFYRGEPVSNGDQFCKFGYLLRNSRESWDTHYRKAQDVVQLLTELPNYRVISVTSSCNTGGKGVTFVFFEKHVSANEEPSIAPSLASNQLRVLSFNLWVGGGLSLANCIKIMQQSEADVIGLQETNGALVSMIADVLGFYHCPNAAVLSRFPLESLPSGNGVRILYGETVITVLNVHPTAYPYPPYILHDTRDVTKAIQTECEIQLCDLEPVLLEASDAQENNLGPVIITGDFNAASHLDYSPHETFGNVEWPTSSRLAKLGFLDSYFTSPSHERPEGCGSEPERGITWTPMPEEETKGIFDRIDFIYYFPGQTTMSVENSITLDGSYSKVQPWPSDHRAVLSHFSFA